MKSSSPVKLQGYWMMGDIAKGIDPFSSPTKHRGCRNNVENDAVSIPGQFAGVVRGFYTNPLFRKQISALACA
jgi:hypothetical protein